MHGVLLAVNDRPAGEVDRAWREVEQRDGLPALIRLRRIDQRRDDHYARESRSLHPRSRSLDRRWQGLGHGHGFRLADRIACHVVRVERLRLEGEEEGQPAILVRKMEEETAILPDPVVPRVLPHAPLIHVDVVDAVAGLEVERRPA